MTPMHWLYLATGVTNWLDVTDAEFRGEPSDWLRQIHP